MVMHDSVPRLFVTLIGDVKRERFAQVKYGYFLNVLEKSFPVVICDATLRGLPRLINALQVFSPNLTRWKERFYQNIPAFQLRSQKVARALRQLAGKIDVIIQIGVLCDAQFDSHIPSLIYTDYTSQLASRKPGLGRSPHTTADFQKWRAMEKQAFQRSSFVCTRGEFIRQSVIADYAIAENKVKTIGGGVNFGDLPILKEKSGSTVPTVLFIGKDFYRKGGDILLKSFHQVRKHIPDARLIMVTEGIPAGRYDLTGVQIIAPTWDRMVIRSLYEQADCFVLLSRLETWGDVLLEAMSYGLPCIGVTGEAMGEIIEHEKTGFVIPPEDIVAISQAIVQLLENRALRQQYGKAARQRIESDFTWDQVVKRLSPFIKSTTYSLSVPTRRSV